ncbi:MAG TPA: 16S rRNA (adenine(1518)-N(6)/adenine(1519)-N(6))-dimethyltransferase RsmA [Candidatus Acidoferrum sp.]|nr:16S rRNA (adenine(1518)-N(6)/adenine(1519)-N(6))-dimethyltransferase RsmA [Candidatus Acidoferrum sp.]
MTRQKLGQHFLQDAGWRGKIAATLPLATGETWIEIGAGHGEMTQHLAGDSRRVAAIETDAWLASRLRIRGTQNPAEWQGVTIIHGDVLELNLAELGGGAEKFRVYGNLPYYITSPILRHLFRWAERIASIHIVVQLEVAVRIAARPGRRDYGYLSVLSQFYTKPEIILRIPPGAFRPPPRVASALLRMNGPGERASLGVADEESFLAFVRTCFGKKRKTLRNNLRDVAGDDRVRSALGACNLRPHARAEQLSLRQFAALFENLR